MSLDLSAARTSLESGDLASVTAELDRIWDPRSGAATLPSEDRRDLAEFLTLVGGHQFSHGELGTSLQCFERALTILENTEPNSVHLAIVLNNIGHLCRFLRRTDDALASFSRAIAIYEQVAPGSLTMADPLRGTGIVRKMLGDYQEAVTFYQRALAIDDVLAPASPNHALDLGDLGVLWFRLGDRTMATDYMNRAVDIGLSTTEQYTTAGELALSLSNLEDASVYFHRALTVAEKTSPRWDILAECQNNLGRVHKERGEITQAIDRYRQALSIAEGQENELTRVAMYLNNIGGCYSASNELDMALDYYQRALEIAASTAPDSLFAAKYTNNVGAVYGKMGDLDLEFSYARRALDIARRVAPKSLDTAIYMNNLGRVCRLREQYDEALAYYKGALAIDEALAPSSVQTAVHLNNAAMAYRGREQFDEAIPLFERAVRIIETTRSRSGAVEARESFFSQWLAIYGNLINSYLGRAGPADVPAAFNTIERCKARGMLELLTERKIEIHPTTAAEQTLYDRETELRDKLARTARRASSLRADPETAPEQLAEAESTELELQRELDLVLSDLRLVFPAYAELLYPVASTLAALQQSLPSDLLVLDYFLSESGESFLVAVRSSFAQVMRLESSPTELGDLVETVIGPPRNGQPMSDDGKRAISHLSSVLLGSGGTPLWAGVTRVLVVADRMLHYLPFELLSVPGTDGYLGEVFQIAYSPSVTVWQQIRDRTRPTRNGGFLGFGLGFDGQSSANGRPNDGAASRAATIGVRLAPIPAARTEVEAIREIFEPAGVCYLDREATKRRVRESSDGPSYIHFATHALLDDHNPMLSGLVLAPPSVDEIAEEQYDDLLEVHEMFGLTLQGALVVCSACQTGLGQLRSGEGIVGMARALFFAGARCVVLSLWPVHDAATKELMTAFYGAMHRGAGAALAMQEARRTVHAAWEDPFFWAGFVVLGDGWSAS